MVTSRFAYVTLVANREFIPGVKALANSITLSNSPYPLVCMTLSNVYTETKEALKDTKATIKEIHPLDLTNGFVSRHTNEAIENLNPMTKGSKPSFHSKLLNFAKIRLWEMTEFDKIVFLDADTVVVKNIDRLFLYPAFSAAPNLYQSTADFNRINSGVFVAQPSLSEFELMMKVLDAPGAYWPRTDQTFLEKYWGDKDGFILGLPYFYNSLQYLWFNMPELWDWEKIHLIHYQFEKPWDESSFGNNEVGRSRRILLDPLLQIWRAVYEGGEFRHLQEDCKNFISRHPIELKIASSCGRMKVFL